MTWRHIRSSVASVAGHRLTIAIALVFLVAGVSAQTDDSRHQFHMVLNSITRTGGSPVYVMVVADGSYSVGPKVFRDMVDGVAHLGNVLLDPANRINAQLGFSVFADDVTVPQQLTSNRDLFVGHVTPTKFPGGFTRTDLALQEARKSLNAVVGTAQRFVILFSDGLPLRRDNKDIFPETLAVAETLKREGITIICVGFGDTDLEKLSQIASKDMYFRESNSVVDLLKQFEIRQPEVSLEATMMNKPVGFKDHMEIDVDIENLHKVPIPAGSQLKIGPVGDTIERSQVKTGESGKEEGHIEPHFKPATATLPRDLLPGEKQTVRVRVFPRNTQYVTPPMVFLPEKLELALRSPSGYLYLSDHSHFLLQTELFVKDWIRGYKDGSILRVNVLPMGEVGSGKSSFGNSIATLLAWVFQTLFQTGEATSNSLTASIEKEKVENVPLLYYNTKGFKANELYGPRFFDALLDGVVPSGYQGVTDAEWDAHLSDWSNRLRVASVPYLARLGLIEDPRIHVVLFTIKLASIKNKEIIKIYQELALQARRRDCKVLVLVADLQDKPAAYQEATLEEVRRALGVANGSVHAMYYYQNPTKASKEFWIDKHNFIILHFIMEQAASFQAKHPFFALPKWFSVCLIAALSFWTIRLTERLLKLIGLGLYRALCCHCCRRRPRNPARRQARAPGPAPHRPEPEEAKRPEDEEKAEDQAAADDDQDGDDDEEDGDELDAEYDDLDDLDLDPEEHAPAPAPPRPARDQRPGSKAQSVQPKPSSSSSPPSKAARSVSPASSIGSAAGVSAASASSAKRSASEREEGSAVDSAVGGVQQRRPARTTQIQSPQPPSPNRQEGGDTDDEPLLVEAVVQKKNQ